MSKLTRCWRRMKPRTKILLVVMALLVVIVTHYLFAWKIVCSNLEIRRYIKLTCQLHKEGRALGDLCHDLCSDQVQVLSCQTLHTGKQVVFSAEWKGSKVFIKSQKHDFTESEEDQVYWVDSNRVKHYPEAEEFESMLRSLLAANLNVTVDGDIVGTLWPSYEGNRSTLTHQVMNNVWALALSNEYTLARVFEEHATFPRVLGTCGSFYAMEHLQPVVSQLAFRARSFNAWTLRVKAALLVVEFLEEMKHIFPQPLHLCDMKLEHFGLGENGGVKFLDLDSVFPRPVLNKLLADGSSCRSHNDCSFFACASRCNMVLQSCDSPVSNDNLQSACQRIFVGASGPGGGSRLLMRDPGLLAASPHATQHLTHLLKACSFPYGDTFEIQGAVPEDVQRDLIDALHDILQFENFAQY